MVNSILKLKAMKKNALKMILFSKVRLIKVLTNQIIIIYFYQLNLLILIKNVKNSI